MMKIKIRKNGFEQVRECKIYSKAYSIKLYDQQNSVRASIDIDTDSTKTYVIGLWVHESLRCQGIATYLLQHIIKGSKGKRILLNDESENYRLENNVYLKQGFKYKNAEKSLMYLDCC